MRSLSCTSAQKLATNLLNTEIKLHKKAAFFCFFFFVCQVPSHKNCTLTFACQTEADVPYRQSKFLIAYLKSLSLSIHHVMPRQQPASEDFMCSVRLTGCEVVTVTFAGLP